MRKIFEKFNKLSLPATILIASVILGGFYYTSEVNKQRSIERQQQIKIEQEQQERLAQELKEQQVRKDAENKTRLNALLLDACLDDAYTNYSTNFKNECKARNLKEDCSLPLTIANSLEKTMSDDKEVCFKKYP